ncbi:MAG TPA: ester cyclase [Polyangiaceae bacterium]
MSHQIAHNTVCVHRYFEEVWNQGKLDVLDELLAGDYVNHSSSIPDPVPGPAGVKPIVAAMRRAFPDLRYRIDQLVASDDAVAVRVTLSGTHRGDFFGIPPTGKHFEVTQTNIERFRDGRIVEHWRNTDELSWLRQLGVVP